MTASIITPDHAHFDTAKGRLVDELRRVVVPVATLLDIGLGFIAGNHIARATAATTAEGLDSSQTIWLSPLRSHMTSSVTLPLDSTTDHLVVSFAEGKENVTRIMPHLITLAINNLELKREEESLLEELSSSWENLEAVYEISSDLQAVTTPGELLARIMNRAVTISDGMSAALWIQDGNELFPHASANTRRLSPKSEGQGLVGTAISSRRAIVINNPERLAAEGCADPELYGATSLALAPIATRQGLLGALEVWSEDGATRFDSHTINLIQALALQAAMVIENDRLHKATIEAERLQQEIEIGSKIQEVLLLGQLPEPVIGLEIAAYTLPSRQIDGDFYEFFRQRDDCLDIIVGDVMGKGIPAALVGAATKSHLLHALNRLLASSEGAIPEPEQIINAAHRQVTSQLIDCESFTTLCLARFDIATRQLTFVDCGHTQTLHSQPSGKIEFLHGVNVPLGFSEKEVYEQATIGFEPGDVFVFYSDGLTEARDPAGELFGEGRLAECVCANRHLGPARLIESIRSAVVTFADSEIFGDDLTCVVVRIEPPAADGSRRTELITTSNLNELETIRSFVRDVATRIPELHDSDSLVLAVNEAATNIMRHAYRGRVDGEIRFVAQVQPGALVIDIFHSGEGFDRASVAPPEFDRPREGGLGLFIIEQCFDEVAYTTDEHGKHCTHLVKTINT